MTEEECGQQPEQAQEPEEEKEDAGAEEESKAREEAPPGNLTTRLYDKLPINFKQADLIAKIAVGVLVVVVLIAIITAPGPG